MMAAPPLRLILLLLPVLSTCGSLAPAPARRGPAAALLLPRRPLMLRLTGGGAPRESESAEEVNAARAQGEPGAPPLEPRAWQVEHVLAFLERLRPKFRDRTDLYRTMFTDNDIDGAVLLGLTPEKLEKAHGPAPACVRERCGRRQTACARAHDRSRKMRFRRSALPAWATASTSLPLSTSCGRQVGCSAVQRRQTSTQHSWRSGHRPKTHRGE
jgi:hypothetical protein